jgi:hypothetical protein
MGSELLFIAADNTKFYRTVTGLYDIPDTDLRLVSWDDDLPSAIGFAKVLGPDYARYLPDFNVDDINGSGLVRHCGLYLNRNGQAFPCDVNALSDGSQVQIRQSLDEPQRSMWVVPDSGDSAGPVCIIDQDGKLVVLGFLYSAGGGSAVAPNHSTINTNMAGTGYTLTVMDYTPYHNFG